MNRRIILSIIFALIFNLGYAVETSNESTTNIGVIIDLDSRVGREQKTAMIIAAHTFNNNSSNHTLALHFKSITNNPVRAISAAEDLIKETQAHVIIGLQTWEQAALVADIENQPQVPVLSLASASVSPQFMQHRWPFLIQMGTNNSEQINCIAAIVKSYEWRKVIAIYEDDVFSGDSGMLRLLSESLQTFDAEVEYHLPLLPISSLTNPERVIQKEVTKLLTKESRVFIVLRSSLSLATKLFKIAKKKGLMGRDSVWILTDPLSGTLDLAKNSVSSSIQGALGIQIHHSVDTIPFLDFKGRFRKLYRNEYPDEDNMTPGFHALQAYDSITAVGNAVQNSGNNKTMVENILSNNFTGLSGNIHFKSGMLSAKPIFMIKNFVGKSYKDLGFWSSEYGFQEHWVAQEGVDHSMKRLLGLINWPGELNRFPKGWATPTDAKPMKIGVPGNTSFDKFVKVEIDAKTNKTIFSGFSIKLFEEVVDILERDYPFPYEFISFDGRYDELIEQVINKTFDAVVGDITILANRTKYVEFTQPYAESGLSMLVKVKDSQRAWIFLKPFTWNMWIATFGILFYTMFVIWFMEHQSNPDFGGPLKNQLGTAMWFTFSTLFGSHREKINSNYTRAVIVVWLFVVFVLTSSYGASLTSMLTVPRLEPSVTDIDFIKKTNAIVGCDGDSFVYEYLKEVLKLPNIKNISKQYDYPGEFKSGNITAAFLELPYKKVFLDEYCKDYTEVGTFSKFGGLGFVFQKGSPIARDVSRAILILSENGRLKDLEKEWFGSTQKCSDTNNAVGMGSLSFQSFWALYLVSGVTSTICFFVFLIRILKSSSAKNRDASYQDIVSVDEAIWNQGIRRRSFKRASTFANTIDKFERRSSQLIPHTEIEIVTMK